MPNRLSTASSPYLLQHRDNPVDWYPWGDEAFAAARDLDRPVLLSVGYATCHWCHVMAHESFEDAATAAYINDHFIAVKVDREERPDVDRIYMDAVQAMTGRGGWPMTVFLMPDGRPFFAGTYFPKESRGGYPSFLQVMGSVMDAWDGRRPDLEGQADRLTEAVQTTIPPSQEAPGKDVVGAAIGALADQFDADHGGFGGAPKFPQAPTLELLLRTLALGLAEDEGGNVDSMLRTTLDKMAAGGIYDHLGGGFSRYSVDRFWSVPHFEKMLYDNALLARVYLRGWQLLGEPRYRSVADQTLEYMLRDLADPAGGFHSGEDADSEGMEGTFYVWRWDELTELLGPDLELVAAVFGATPAGNFEGANVLHRASPLNAIANRFSVTMTDLESRVADAAARMQERRNGRVRPAVDDKVVTAWNGLALRALAEAAAVLDDARYLTAAERLATFAAEHLVTPGPRLVRTWRRGVAGPAGFCDDYGAMAVGLFTLYAVTGDERWFTLAESLTRAGLELFAAPDGGFLATPTGGETLIARPKNLMDNPTPSDNALMAEALQILAAYTADSQVLEALDGTYRAAGMLVDRYPAAVGHMLAVMATSAAGIKEVAIVGDRERGDALAGEVWRRFRPDCVVARGNGATSSVPLLAGRTAPRGEALAFVCRWFACEMPVSDPDALRTML